MPYKTFADLELLPASDINDYLMRQTVIRVANATERNAIPSPPTGMLIQRPLGSGWVIERYNGSAWELAAGETGWKTPGALAGGWSSANLAFRRSGSTISFNGEVWGGTLGATLFTLPAGFCPASRMTTQIVRISTTTLTAALLYVATNGDVTVVISNGASAPPGLSLAPVHFHTDQAFPTT